MNRQFGICAQLTFLFLASSCFAQDAPTTKALSPELHISVQDSANVPPELLAAAEAEVHRIFQQAGVETLWRNCSEKVENTQPAGCHVVGSSYLVLKILPRATSAQLRERNDVLGTATLDEKGSASTDTPFTIGFNGWRKIGDSRLHFWAMYSRMKSVTCCCGRILIPSAESCRQDGLVTNYGEFPKEPCCLLHSNPMSCGIGCRL